MKKIIKGVMLLVAVTFISSFCVANDVLASQGVYGCVYAFDREVFVSGAVVKAYYGNTVVAQATASACGYYTISLPTTLFPREYHLIVDNLQYSTRIVLSGGGCGSVDISDHFTGESEVEVYAGYWYNVSIDTM